MDWNAAKIVVILSLAIPLPFAIMYKDSALFADDLRKSPFHADESCLSILVRRSRVQMEFNEASVSKRNLLTGELSDPSDLLDVKTLKVCRTTKSRPHPPLRPKCVGQFISRARYILWNATNTVCT